MHLYRITFTSISGWQMERVVAAINIREATRVAEQDPILADDDTLVVEELS